VRPGPFAVDFEEARRVRAQSFFRYVAGATPVILSAAVGVSALAAASPPAPCNGAAQITDASEDGHHPSSDVLAAWFSEASGHLQAVIKVRAGTWVAEHDDADIDGSGYAFVFTVGGRTAYVRVNTPGPEHATDPVTYDYGTYTSPGGFASAGATTGGVEVATGGTATIDVPAATGAVSGATLANPYVVTYDGISGGVPDWVDHAPGGIDPGEASYGADYVVGACATGIVPPGGTPVPTPTNAVTALQLDAPARVTGRRTVTIRGKVLPARAGVAVTLTRTGHSTVVSHLTSAADGTFSAKLAIGETTRLRAVAEGIGSRQLTVTAHTKVKIKVSNRRDGSAVVTGKVDPKLPGRVLWLRANAVAPSAKTTTRNGTFRLRLKHPRPGRYQAVVIPTGDRAERATSNSGVIR
jgi:hypothetical protein